MSPIYRISVQPMRFLEYASRVAAKYAKLAGKRMYVTSATQARLSESIAIRLSKLG